MDLIKRHSEQTKNKKTKTKQKNKNKTNQPIK